MQKKKKAEEVEHITKMIFSVSRNSLKPHKKKEKIM
jgi:hypothetical protein